MKPFVFMLLSCVLGADVPMTLEQVLAKSKVPLNRLEVDATLAEARRLTRDAAGFLRESPSVTVSAGPRTAIDAPATTDQTIEIDAPLMLRRRPARKLNALLDSSAPTLYEAADLENRLAIHQAFLDVWLAERIEGVMVEDVSQVQTWLEIADARNESGADPAFQLELVKGEYLKSRLDMTEAKRNRIQTWHILRSLSDLPESPQPLDYSHDANDVSGHKTPDIPKLSERYQMGTLRRAAIARRDLEVGHANLNAALSDSRWSISSSYAKEGLERVAKIGLAFKFPRAGESSSIKAEQRARVANSARTAELALEELDLRFATAIQTIESCNYLELPDTATSLEALTMRLSEGKDQPSDVIPIRRQFLELRISELHRQHSIYAAYAEISTLTAGKLP